MTAKFLFIKNKIINEEKRIKFNIRDDLDTIEHFMIKVSSKFNSFTFEEVKDENNEPEEEPNGINGIDDVPENAYKLNDLHITYSIVSDGRHLQVQDDDEFKEVIESHCELAAKEFIIKELIIAKAGD
eukprot:475012_1